MKQLLLDIFNQSFVFGKVPLEWNQCVICPIYKRKGDPTDCKNYRGISLMSHTAKLYERILERRLKSQVEHRLFENQSGFRPGRGTTDQIFSFRLYLESWQLDIEQHICFSDLEKAFDRVPRQRKWNTLANLEHQIIY